MVGEHKVLTEAVLLTLIEAAGKQGAEGLTSKNLKRLAKVAVKIANTICKCKDS